MALNCRGSRDSCREWGLLGGVSAKQTPMGLSDGSTLDASKILWNKFPKLLGH